MLSERRKQPGHESRHAVWREILPKLGLPRVRFRGSWANGDLTEQISEYYSSHHALTVESDSEAYQTRTLVRSSSLGAAVIGFQVARPEVCQGDSPGTARGRADLFRARGDSPPVADGSGLRRLRNMPRNGSGGSAEGVGFEPTVPSQGRSISSRVQSTTLPPFPGDPAQPRNTEPTPRAASRVGGSRPSVPALSLSRHDELVTRCSLDPSLP